MTSEERIASLHMRMDCLKKKRDRQERLKTAALGSGCGVLAVCLILLICGAGQGGSGGTAGLYSGATMLFENAGGYVAIAVAAFMAGVIIAVACIRYRQKQEGTAKTEDMQQAVRQERTPDAKAGKGGEE